MSQFVAALSVVGKSATIGSAEWVWTVNGIYGSASRRSDQRVVSAD